MPENDINPAEEKLLILPLGEESKKITQVISNDTARQIIELLADAPLSASDISERLQAPISTIVYNLENLESVGLIKVEKIRYSEKGRQVKIYAPVRKLIVVVPEKTDKKSVADVLRKYLGVLLAAVFASILIEFVTRRMNSRLIQTTGDTLIEAPSLPSNATSLPATVMNETGTPEVVSKAMPAATPISDGAASSAAPDLLTRISDMVSAHPGIAFLLGCLFAIALFVIMDYRGKRIHR